MSSSAPSSFAWHPAVAAASVTTIANYTFANKGGPGDTITDSGAGIGTAAALAALAVNFDGHTVVVGDRLLLLSETATYQNGIYIATMVQRGQVATLTIGTPGTTYTNGTYKNLATTSGGSGVGLKVDITVSGGAITAATVSAPLIGDAPGQGGLQSGSGYAVGDTVVLVAPGVGVGSGTLAMTVATLSAGYVLTRAPDANTSEQFPGMSCFVVGGSTLSGKAYVQSNAPVTLDAFGVTTVGTIVQPGGTLTNGTYTNVALTGGSGTGAIGTVTVSGTVTGVTVTSAGVGYLVGDVLNFAGYGFGTSGTVTVATTTVLASSAVTFAAIV